VSDKCDLLILCIYSCNEEFKAT